MHEATRINLNLDASEHKYLYEFYSHSLSIKPCVTRTVAQHWSSTGRHDSTTLIKSCKSKASSLSTGSSNSTSSYRPVLSCMGGQHIMAVRGAGAGANGRNPCPAEHAATWAAVLPLAVAVPQARARQVTGSAFSSLRHACCDRLLFSLRLIMVALVGRWTFSLKMQVTIVQSAW